MISYAEKKANDYIQMFQKQNFDLNQIIKYLSNENPEFKDNYNKILQEQNNLINQQLKQVNTNNILNFKTLNVQEDFATLDAHVKALRIESTIFTTLSAACRYCCCWILSSSMIFWH